MKNGKPTAVSLFSGCGGLDLGFKQAGFKIIWANDFDLDSTKTYSMNFNHKIFHEDITNIDSSSVPKNADVLLGGFPCQGFSVANNKRGMHDKRNFLYKEMIRIVNDSRPKFFVAENVKGMMKMQGGKVIEMIKRDFEKIGYDVNYKLLNAASFGVPQTRERVFMIGNRIGVENTYPAESHYVNGNGGKQIILAPSGSGLLSAVTTKDVIGHLNEVELSNEPISMNDATIYNHAASTNVADKFWGRKHDVSQAEICDYLKSWRTKAGISTKKIDEIFGYRHTAGHWFRKDNNSGSIPTPSDWIGLKNILKFDDKYDKSVTVLIEKEIKFEQSLRITNWNRPSDTITATSPEIHVNKKRRMSVRECAILQTFPNDFVFHGSINSAYRQIGNAVPPLLAKVIAAEIKKSLHN